MSDKFRREAIANIPKGYYVVPSNENLKDSDLVWDWTNSRFIRADADSWKFKTNSIPRDEIICAVRRAELAGFESASRRSFTIKKTNYEN